jgi:hypothetical protein
MEKRLGPLEVRKGPETKGHTKTGFLFCRFETKIKVIA